MGNSTRLVVQTMIRLPRDLHESLVKSAKTNGHSLNREMVTILSQPTAKEQLIETTRRVVEETLAAHNKRSWSLLRKMGFTQSSS